MRHKTGFDQPCITSHARCRCPLTFKPARVCRGRCGFLSHFALPIQAPQHHGSTFQNAVTFAWLTQGRPGALCLLEDYEMIAALGARHDARHTHLEL